jgi:hypothetical protein
MRKLPIFVAVNWLKIAKIVIIHIALTLKPKEWSLLRNEKPIVLFERHCHATEKSEAIACARSCRSSWF